MIYSVKKEIKEIAIAHKNFEIDRETAIQEVKQVARLEGDDEVEAVDYFERLVD